MGEKELLEFYKKQLNELHTSDDKYKEKVDTYLRELIADRHELVSENLRKGEKISDLQTALVDLQLSCFEEREKFLKVTAENDKLKLNELRLHENIRHLLNVTKEKDLRDRIIYILEDPKVEIGYRYENLKSSGASTLKHKRSSDNFLKEQVHQLQSKLDEHSKNSQNKTDVLLEDCKVILEKSKEKLLQNEEEIKALQKRLQDAEELLKRENKPTTSLKSLEKNKTLGDSKSNSYKFKSRSYEVKADFTALENISSCAGEMRLPLVFLSKILKKTLSLLNNMQTSQAFIQASKHPKQAATHKYVSETDIVQLQNYVRQCTRLSYEANNVLKSLKKILASKENLVSELNINSALVELESTIEELAASTAEADLITISLSRATFFDHLTAPKQLFMKYGVKEISNLSKYVHDVNKIVLIYKTDSELVLKAVKLTEIIQENVSKSRSETEDYDSLSEQSLSTQGQETNRLDSLSKSRSASNFKEKSSMREQDKLGKLSIEKRFSKSTVEIDELIKRIDKTLSKINHIQSGEYIRDNEFCQYLGEQVKALTEKLNKLYNEFNVQDIQDQFSEYTSVTLDKLETIAQQSRDAVISAEAQISAHRSHAKNLSQKLKGTEDLLRESINECLSLKQKLHKEKLQRTEEMTQFRYGLQEKLQSVADFDELETAVKEVISSTQSTRKRDMNPESSKETKKHGKASYRSGQPSYRGSQASLQEKDSISIDSDEEETAVKDVYSGKLFEGHKKPSGPFECMYCKQGSEHKLCDEKIKELRASNRKLKTELKLLQQEMKEEKKVSKLSQDQADKATRESANQSETLNRRLESLESRNASLLEQLNLERNRLKKIEKFRRFEIAGSQTDIKNLKIKIQDLEKQLSKAVMIFEHDKKDLELLKTVHTTAQNSKQAAEAVKRLKRKLYELETDLKHL